MSQGSSGLLRDSWLLMRATCNERQAVGERKRKQNISRITYHPGSRGTNVPLHSSCVFVHSMSLLERTEKREKEKVKSLSPH